VIAGFYETPEWATHALLDALEIGPRYEGHVIDAGSGSGAIARAVAARAPKADVLGVEIDPALVAHARESSAAPTIAYELADWLAWSTRTSVDVIISKPPHDAKNPEKTHAFIRHAIDLVGRKGLAAFLLRMDWMLKKEQRALRQGASAPDVLAFERKIAFTAAGGGLAHYAWFIWGHKRVGKFSVACSG
jgi:predicted RNA methylase